MFDPFFQFRFPPFPILAPAERDSGPCSSIASPLLRLRPSSGLPKSVSSLVFLSFQLNQRRAGWRTVDAA
jgi:hypothetical protein